ncbi:MAG: substrate-binding domain-containing protein [Desulfurococcaceae archaeon TW002]
MFRVVYVLVLFLGLVIFFVFMYRVFLVSDQTIRVRISTTTSLYATGLLDYLASKFSSRYPETSIEFIAVGTGAALKLAEKKDVCAVLIHEPGLEKQYLEKGIIDDRKIFAYNYFVVVGPNEDPAGVSNSTDIVEAFRRIYSVGKAGKAFFISRGDKSGTHVKELSIWRSAGLSVERSTWRLSCGCGMSEALVIANELGAYTLSDLGTYLKLEKAGRLSKLRILYENKKDNTTINIYSAYVVASCEGLERKYAEFFINFIYENQQDLISSFGVGEYREPLFYPAKNKELVLQELWEVLTSEYGWS